jgi:hypothetical protein
MGRSSTGKVSVFFWLSYSIDGIMLQAQALALIGIVKLSVVPEWSGPYKRFR